MGKKILVSYDFNKNQIINAVVHVLASAPGSPAEGQVYYNSVDKKFYGYNGTTWIDLSNLVGATDLSFSRDGTTVTVTSSTGTDAVLPAATPSLAGVMSAADKTKLDGIATGANNYTHPNHTGDVTSVGDGDTTIVNGAVTNAKMADMAANTIKGRITSLGTPQDLSAAQVRSILNVEDGADVTDAINVAAAGATMNADTSLSGNGYFLNENNMASNDATKVASQASIVAYVQQEIGDAVTGGFTFKGEYDANTNTPDLDTSPSGTIKQGDVYVVSGAGDFFTEAVQVGDMIIAKQDAPTQLSHWALVNKNIPDIVDASTTAKGIIEIATEAEHLSGISTTLAATPAGVQAMIDALGSSVSNKYTDTIGDGTSTSIAVTHNLGERWVVTGVYDVSTNEQVECDVVLTSTTQTTFIFNIAPTSNQYRVVIVG